MADTPKAPDCFEFAMDFLGEPETSHVRAYVTALQAELERKTSALEWIVSVNAMDYEYVAVARAAMASSDAGK